MHVIRPIIFGKFILLERISVGGMAEVFRAKLLNAPGFERFFAIKRILPHLAADKDFVTMFINEAKVAVELEHPNVCQIYELGRLGQSHYIAMEYIAGRDVLAMQNYYRRQRKIMSVSQACYTIAQAATGMDYAHKAVDSSGQMLGLIHRDVSPQNLLVSFDGLVKLIDFGVAKASHKSAKTQSGVLKGKFSYMSPEQASNGDVDHRSDIFALGIVFWELLTGRRLFQSESEYAILDMINTAEIELPSKLNHMIPDRVDKICMRALERDPNKRYAWASEMVIDLYEFINSCDPPFTAWHLQTWMCTTFADELESEWTKLPIFNSINTAEDIERYNAEQAEKDGLSQEQKRELGIESYVAQAPVQEDEELYSSEFSFKKALAEEGERQSAPGKPPSLRGRPTPRLPKIHGRLDDSKPPPRLPSMDKLPRVGSKSIPGVKPLSVPGVDAVRRSEPSQEAVSHQEGSSSSRLSIYAKEDHSDDSDLVPEGLSPTVEDPEHLRIKRVRRKAKTRNTLYITIFVICALIIASSVLLMTGVIKLPVPKPELPQSAQLTLEVVPDSADARLSLYRYPKEVNSEALHTGSGTRMSFVDLEAGRYAIDVEVPGYEPESFTLSIDNGSSESRLEMTQALPEITTYEINIAPEDAKIVINDEASMTQGSTRKFQGEVGHVYRIQATQLGYAPELRVITLERDMSINIALEEVMGRLTLKSYPTPSAVFISDERGRMRERGMTPLVLEGLDPREKLEIEVRRRGYATWQRVIEFESGHDKQIFADLEPL